jgi:UDP-hydrolysing UDP-N-acetyl-D-glucosamine 2-epimerase
MTAAVKRVAVVTGSRAEYGFLTPLLRALHAAPSIDMRLIVTGMHLSPEFGMTVREVEQDVWPIYRRVEMLLSSDTTRGTAKSIGLGVLGAADALGDLAPDLVVLVGDRFEILAFAIACVALKLPVAHLAGGDVTEGAIDDAIRHAITKVAHVHFVTNAESARRVLQMGESPDRVHNVGSPGLDRIRELSLLKGKVLEEALGATLGSRNVLVTYHPVTLDTDEGRAELIEMLAALDSIDNETTVWVTLPNADSAGRELASTITAWVGRDPARRRVRHSLGSLRYLSLLGACDVILGNSSSGLYEAPSLGTRTVNVGRRQQGRLAGNSVVHCEGARDAIASALRLALSAGRGVFENPYGDGRAVPRILSVIEGLPSAETLLRKTFVDVGADCA